MERTYMGILKKEIYGVMFINPNTTDLYLSQKTKYMVFNNRCRTE